MNITDIVLRNAGLYPDRAAIVDVATGTSWSWIQLRGRIAATVAALRAHGVARGERVVTVGQHSLDHWALYYACGYLGAILVPLSFRWNAELIDAAARELEPRLVITDADHAELTERAGAASGAALTTEAWLSDLGAEEVLLDVAPDFSDEPHIIIYTSGTTGSPKGVVISHQRTVLDAWRTIPRFGYDADTRMLVHYPTFHVSGWDSGKLPAYTGGTLYQLAKFDGDRVAEALSQYGITTFHSLPTALYAVADSLEATPRDVSSLGAIIYSAFDSRTLDRVRSVLADNGSVPIECHMYGLTEGCPEVAMWVGHAPYGPGLIGDPVPGVRLCLADGDGNPDPFSLEGEILVGAESCMSGYWNQPEQSRAALAGGWLHTGDVGRRDPDSGMFYLVDRIKDVIRSGGEIVSSRKIEESLLLLAQVRDVAVIGTPSPKYEEEITAVIEWMGQVVPTLEEFRQLAREILPSYQVPRRVEFVDSLPRNVLGKVEKARLRSRFAEQGGAGS